MKTMKIAAALLILVGGCATGQQDTTSTSSTTAAYGNADEQQYVAELRRDNVPITDDDRYAVAYGHDICNLLKDSDDRIAMNAIVTGGKFSMSEARTIVDASKTYLCPWIGNR